MDTHVKVLAVLNIVLGMCGLLIALLMVLVFGGVMVGASGEPDAAVAVPIIGAIGSGVVFFMLLLSLPGIVIGIGLWKFRPWARIAGIVLAVLSLINIPFGTILGIYGLWVLFNKQTEQLFTVPAVP